MTLAEFRQLLDAASPPPNLAGPLLALWWAGRSDWNRAHDLVASDGSSEGAWVHAHLHRQEGDHGNARYWYGRAGRPSSSGSVDAEWATIAETLLRQGR